MTARGRGEDPYVPTPSLNHFKRLCTLLRSALGRTTLTTLGLPPTGAGTVHPGRREGTNSSQTGCRGCARAHVHATTTNYYSYHRSTSILAVIYHHPQTPLPRLPPRPESQAIDNDNDPRANLERLWGRGPEAGRRTQYSTYYLHTRGSIPLFLPPATYWRRRQGENWRAPRFPYGCQALPSALLHHARAPRESKRVDGAFAPTTAASIQMGPR